MKDTIKHTYLAADFGGGSGRIIAGFLAMANWSWKRYTASPTDRSN